MGWVCSFCEMEFPSKLELRTHVSSEHQVHEDSETRVREDSSKPPFFPWFCSLCEVSKKFPSMEELRAHLELKHPEIWNARTKETASKIVQIQVIGNPHEWRAFCLMDNGKMFVTKDAEGWAEISPPTEESSLHKV